MGEHGLVVRPVAVVLGPFGGDIGRQGHDADVTNGLVQHRAGQVEAKGNQAVLALVDYGGVETAQQAGAVRL